MRDRGKVVFPLEIFKGERKLLEVEIWLSEKKFSFSLEAHTFALKDSHGYKQIFDPFFNYFFNWKCLFYVLQNFNEFFQVGKNEIIFKRMKE